MAIFDQFKALIGSKPEQRSTLSNPSSWFIEWLNGGPSVAGQKVNPETALKVSTVYALFEYGYVRLPALAIAMPVDPGRPALVALVFRLVLQILRFVNLAKVREAIVRAVVIYMVYVLGGPTARHVEPS
jgi:hypothetical protein